jgi:hypothetical protein
MCCVFFVLCVKSFLPHFTNKKNEEMHQPSDIKRCFAIMYAIYLQSRYM